MVSFNRYLVGAFIHPLLCAFVESVIHSLIHLFISSSFIYEFNYLLIHPFVFWLGRWLDLSLRQLKRAELKLFGWLIDWLVGWLIDSFW